MDLVRTISVRKTPSLYGYIFVAGQVCLETADLAGSHTR